MKYSCWWITTFLSWAWQDVWLLRTTSTSWVLSSSTRSPTRLLSSLGSELPSRPCRISSGKHFLHRLRVSKTGVSILMRYIELIAYGSHQGRKNIKLNWNFHSVPWPLDFLIWKWQHIPATVMTPPCPPGYGNHEWTIHIIFFRLWRLPLLINPRQAVWAPDLPPAPRVSTS